MIIYTISNDFEPAKCAIFCGKSYPRARSTYKAPTDAQGRFEGSPPLSLSAPMTAPSVERKRREWGKYSGRYSGGVDGWGALPLN